MAPGQLVFSCSGCSGYPSRYILASWPERADARAIIAFIGATTGIVIFGTITGRSDMLILKALGGPDQAGYYGVAVNVAMMATMLAVYATIVAQPRVIPMAQQGRILKLAGWNLIGAGLLSVIMIPLAIWGFPILVPMIFKESFAPAVPILQVLIIGTCADMAFMPVMMTFGIQLYPRTSLIGEIFITIVFLAVAPFAAKASPMAMAWTATGARLAK